MSNHKETLVKWDKDKKWEEIKEIKTVYVSPDGTYRPEAGTRYFLSENGGSKQSLLSEIQAIIISFFFAGIVPFMLFLGIVAWYSVRARIIFALSFLTLLIPVKVYDLSVLKWKIWDCLFDYYSYSIIFDEKIDSKQKYLFAEYPHGVTPVGCLISGFAFPRFSPDIPCYISFFIQYFSVFPLFILSHYW